MTLWIQLKWTLEIYALASSKMYKLQLAINKMGILFE